MYALSSCPTTSCWLKIHLSTMQTEASDFGRVRGCCGVKLRISEGLSAKTMFTVAVSATWLSAIPQLQQCNATVTKCGPGNRACTHTHTPRRKCTSTQPPNPCMRMHKFCYLSLLLQSLMFRLSRSLLQNKERRFFFVFAGTLGKLMPGFLL